MSVITPLPKAGQVVQVRQRQYLVEDVASSDHTSTVVRLSCIDDDARGQELRCLWEHELDAKVLDGGDWDRLAERDFDEPRLFAAYYHSLRWHQVTATDPRLFQAPFRAGIRLEAYQLEPLRKALLLPRVNLFIADDVGLGKTIEAGLIARELLLRKKVRQIVVACPPSVVPQWHQELESRFGLTFAILDRAYIAKARRERGYGVNPWTTHSRFLVSQRLLVDEDYAAGLRDWLGDFLAGSLLILDEAHHAAPAGGQKYAIDSKITKAIRDIAPRFEHRLFLSATPHNGHSNSFSALLEILDPQRFLRGVPVRAKMLEDVIVRRLKEDLREVPGTSRFPVRHVCQIDLSGLPDDTPELSLSRLLDQYRRLRDIHFQGASRSQQAAAGLITIGLQQRLLSSVAAFARTLRVHRRTVERHRQQVGKGASPASPPQAAGLFDLLSGTVDADNDRADLSDADLAAEEDAQVEAATVATGDVASDTETDRVLDEMTLIAEASYDLPDARVLHLLAWIKDNLLATGRKGWNDRRILIFTEYEDTRRYLERQLSGQLADLPGWNDDRVAVYSGSTPQDRRDDIQRAFNGDPARYPLRILIATDAAREGINLQGHCWDLFHFDLPWNPARMEQRNGRIDRCLQPRDDIYCHYFVYTQRPEDRVLQVLVRKTETIRRELGSLAQVIEGRLADTLARGIRHADADRLVGTIRDAGLGNDARATVEEELEGTRQRRDKLREQVERLRTQLDDSSKWAAVSAAGLRAALDSSLTLLGVGPLQVLPPDGTAAERYVFPALEARPGADAGWADTLDTLRAPRRRDQKTWDWRREEPLRPVAFKAADTLTDEVVQLHLEHRVVQRLLGRFLAQGFVYHDLSRACLAQSDDAIPRVVLIGRLCLYGDRGARLHDELIEVAARWYDPKVVKNRPLTPYAREGRSNALDKLRQALLEPAERSVPAKTRKELRDAAAQDMRELLPHLEKRGQEIGDEVEDLLAKRAEREAKAMRELLEGQQKLIRETAEKHAPSDQPDLPGMLADEARQLKDDRKCWQARLAALPREMIDEPQRIRDIYRVRARRVEPVGLVYLWPVTG